MGKSKKDKTSRREFLSLGFLSKENSEENPTASSSQKIKMLTPDGQLVEVDKSVLEKSAERKKVKNDDILNWTKVVK